MQPPNHKDVWCPNVAFPQPCLWECLLSTAGPSPPSPCVPHHPAPDPSPNSPSPGLRSQYKFLLVAGTAHTEPRNFLSTHPFSCPSASAWATSQRCAGHLHFIHLTPPNFSQPPSSPCRTLDIWTAGFFFWLHRVLAVARRIFLMACIQDLVPRPGIEPRPPALECGVLPTGPPGKSLDCRFLDGEKQSLSELFHLLAGTPNQLLFLLLPCYSPWLLTGLSLGACRVGLLPRTCFTSGVELVLSPDLLGLAISAVLEWSPYMQVLTYTVILILTYPTPPLHKSKARKVIDSLVFPSPKNVYLQEDGWFKEERPGKNR